MRVLFLVLLLIACSPTDTGIDYSDPGSFHPTTQPVIIRGCEELKERVRVWNESNPTELQIADC
jgi:hypothetical protein